MATFVGGFNMGFGVCALLAITAHHYAFLRPDPDVGLVVAVSALQAILGALVLLPRPRSA